MYGTANIQCDVHKEGSTQVHLPECLCMLVSKLLNWLLARIQFVSIAIKIKVYLLRRDYLRTNYAAICQHLAVICV